VENGDEKHPQFRKEKGVRLPASTILRLRVRGHALGGIGEAKEGEGREGEVSFQA